MKFWDAPAIVPLLVAEESTRRLQALAAKDSAMLVWWGGAAYALIEKLRSVMPSDSINERNCRKSIRTRCRGLCSCVEASADQSPILLPRERPNRHLKQRSYFAWPCFTKSNRSDPPGWKG